MLPNSVRAARVRRISCFLSAIGTALAIFGSVAAYADEPLDPVVLLQRIKTMGADAVYNKELTGAKWTAFLKEVETGKKPWLEVAAAISSATDAGPSEMLFLSAGIALARSPREVLLITVPKMPIEGVCGYPDMTDAKTDTQQEVVAYLDARIKAVSKLAGSDIETLRAQCLQVLESTKREVQSPKGPFSSGQVNQ